MKENFNKNALLLGIVACGVLVASGASAAGITPEQDELIQKRGMEYNRKYDMTHGYYVPAAEEAPVYRPMPAVTQNRRQPAAIVSQRPAYQAQPAQAAQQPQRQVAFNNSVKKGNIATPPKAVKPAKETVQQQAQPRQAVRQNAQPLQTLRQNPQPMQAVRQNARPGQGMRPQNTQPRELVKPEWLATRWVAEADNDRKMQEAALAYNRNYDSRHGY